MKNLTSALEVIRSRWLVVLVSLVVGLVGVFFVFRSMPRAYEASSRVLIVNENDGRDPSVSSIDLPSVATSTAVLSRVLQDVKMPISLIDLKQGVKARVSTRSSIMEISYRAPSPSLAVAVPNSVADELTRYYGSISTRRAEEDVRKLDIALDEARQRLLSANGELATLTARNPFLGTDNALDGLTGRIDDLQTQRAMVNASLVGDSAAQAAASPSSPAIARIAVHEMMQNDQFYSDLNAGIAKDATTLEVEQARFTDRFPGLRSLQHQVAAEEALAQAKRASLFSSPDAYSPTQAQSAVDASKEGAVVAGDRARAAELDQLLAEAHSRLTDLPQATAKFTWLKLQRDAAEADYLALSSRRTLAVASRAEALSLGSVVVVDRAVLANAVLVGLGGVRLAVLTSFVVMLLALCMAFLAEMFDPKLRRAEQIESLYGSPVITTLGKKS